MIGGAVSAALSGLLGAGTAKRRRPVYADAIEAAAQNLGQRGALENYDRSDRKDFWNDPDRWEGIDDPHKVMIWEVRRRDVIDVRPSPPSNTELYKSYTNHFGVLNGNPYRRMILS